MQPQYFSQQRYIYQFQERTSLPSKLPQPEPKEKPIPQEPKAFCSSYALNQMVQALNQANLTIHELGHKYEHQRKTNQELTQKNQQLIQQNERLKQTLQIMTIPQQKIEIQSFKEKNEHRKTLEYNSVHQIQRDYERVMMENRILRQEVGKQGCLVQLNKDLQGENEEYKKLLNLFKVIYQPKTNLSNIKYMDDQDKTLVFQNSGNKKTQNDQTYDDILKSLKFDDQINDFFFSPKLKL